MGRFRGGLAHFPVLSEERVQQCEICMQHGRRAVKDEVRDILHQYTSCHVIKDGIDEFAENRMGTLLMNSFNHGQSASQRIWAGIVAHV